MAFTGWACSTAVVHGGCKTTADCRSGFVCIVGTGACEAPIGCESTADCPIGTFCDYKIGSCLDTAHCTRDVQCAFGQICDTQRYLCVPGCREVGDCHLSEVCRCPDGSDPGADGGGCAVGQCEAGFCDDQTFCDYGDLCLPDEDGQKRCTKDLRGPYCGGCSYEPGTINHCGDGSNFCLLDRKVNYYRTYCGVDCSQGQICPFGYECLNVLILTHSFCSKDADCPANGEACLSDADCVGARCDAATGRCAGKCSFNEDSARGYCTCTTDDECPQDSCDVTSRTCTLTKQPCSLAGNECAHSIFCSRSAAKSACYIGKNCKPSLGLTCEQVLGGTPTP
jgi:hypothetical protein